MSRLVQITRAGFQVKVQWECEFGDAGIVDQKPELLYAACRKTVRCVPVMHCTGAVRLHYKARENETSICRRHEPVPLHMQVF